VCVLRAVEITLGSTKIKLVYGAEPRVNDKPIPVSNVYAFDGGLMTYTGVMTTVSLDVGMELTWDSGLNFLVFFSICLALYLSGCLSACASVFHLHRYLIMFCVD